MVVMPVVAMVMAAVMPVMVVMPPVLHKHLVATAQRVHATTPRSHLGVPMVGQLTEMATPTATCVHESRPWRWLLVLQLNDDLRWAPLGAGTKPTQLTSLIIDSLVTLPCRSASYCLGFMSAVLVVYSRSHADTTLISGERPQW